MKVRGKYPCTMRRYAMNICLVHAVRNDLSVMMGHTSTYKLLDYIVLVIHGYRSKVSLMVVKKIFFMRAAS